MQTVYPTNLNGYAMNQLKAFGVQWFQENKTVEEMISQAEWNGNLGILYTPFACKIWITRDGKLYANKPNLKKVQA